MTQASAPGKAILFGEHAVVYNQPALAIPLADIRTTVHVEPKSGIETGIHVTAEAIGQSFWLHEASDADPIAVAIRLTLEEVELVDPLAIDITIESDIPIASGLGSGAAVSVALIRALAQYLGARLEDQRISALAFEVEKIHHGTPSGIDNNVVTFEQPLYYKRGHEPSPFILGQALDLVLGHSGVISKTGEVVRGVRERWQAEPKKYETLFESVGALVERAFKALIRGDLPGVGSLMNSNHKLLQDIGVSIEALDRLVESARAAGALGAKLSGAGAGGFMIALVEPETRSDVAQALKAAGAQQVLMAQVA